MSLGIENFREKHPFKSQQYALTSASKRPSENLSINLSKMQINKMEKY